MLPIGYMSAADTAADLRSLIEYLNTHPLFAIGIMLLLGYLLGRGAERIGLPDISGFIVAGLLMSRHVSGVISAEAAVELLVISEVALGLICFTIGAELQLSKLRRVGRRVGWITGGQIGVTFVAVLAATRAVGVDLPHALVLAAIAGTTSPAATVVIVHSLRARGNYVDYLFGTVALGDAAAIVLFSVLLAFVPAMLGIGAAVTVVTAVLGALLDIVLSVLLGVVAGLIIHAIVRHQESNSETLIVTLGLVLLGTAVATAFRLSPLMLSMAAGTTVANLSLRNSRIFRAVEPLTPPVYALFFVTAGTKLQPSLFVEPALLLAGSAYVLARWAGKYCGTWLGAALNRLESPIGRFLGVSLFPQAGVALGLILMLQVVAEEAAPGVLSDITQTVNVVLFAVFVNEVVGPPLSRLATIKGNRMEE